jgi:hypothetical protein
VSTLQRHPHISPPTLPTIVAAASVAIAIAAGGYALTTNHANHPRPIVTHTRTQTQQPPAVQIPGTGRAHIVLNPITGQAHGTVAPPTGAGHATHNSQAKSNIGHREDS